jgi:hypothetical protein
MSNKKFRVWDKLEKRFIYPNKGYQGHYILTLDGKFQNLQNGSGGSEYDVQQFIGILDSEMKEIYEGDVVEYQWCWFQRRIGEVRYNYDRCTYFIGDSKIESINFDSFKIVGNMKENYIYNESGELVTREEYEKNTHS